MELTQEQAAARDALKPIADMFGAAAKATNAANEVLSMLAGLKQGVTEKTAALFNHRDDTEKLKASLVRFREKALADANIAAGGIRNDAAKRANEIRAEATAELAQAQAQHARAKTELANAEADVVALNARIAAAREELTTLQATESK